MTARRPVTVILTPLLVLLGACADPPRPAASPPAIAEATPAVDPFALHAADDDATRYDDLDPVDRANVDDLEEWAETTNGPVAAEAWSSYAAEVERSAIEARKLVVDLGPEVAR